MPLSNEMSEAREVTDQLETRAPESRYLIVGLGNPGRSYRENRHNIGFKVVDSLAERHGISLSRMEMKAILGKGNIFDRSVMLAKPQTFMNDSGSAVGRILGYYDIPPANLMVVYDEIDLPLGTLRLREKGGSGGHNGMKSIITRICNDFPRLRLGIGRPPGKMEAAAYVLRDFKGDDKLIADEMVVSAAEAVESFLREGIDIAMTRHNGRLDER
jgi:PTH1 family peptidyl-tRNA hydrolase